MAIIPTFDQLPEFGWLEQRFRNAPPFQNEEEIFAQEPFSTAEVSQIDYQYNSTDTLVAPVTIRWTRRFYSNGQPYDFDIQTDDGMRIKVDGREVWSRWFPQSPTTYAHTEAILEGWHVLTVEFYNAYPAEAVAVLKTRLDQPVTVQPPLTSIPLPEPPIPPIEVPVEYTSSAQHIVVRLRVIELPADAELVVNVNMRVRPAIPVFDPAYATKNTPIRLAITPIDLPIRGAIRDVVRDVFAGKVDTFFDENRELKTLLNFGNDYQSVITAWKPTDDGIAVKLYRPLPVELQTRDQLWIARELVPSVIDRLNTVYLVDPAELLYLRPPNRNVKLTNQSGMQVDNVTLTSLFSTGALNELRPTNELDEWYTDDFSSAELNVDYSSYKNFIFYSSAQSRLEAFRNKLLNIENITQIISVNSGSLSGVLNTGSLSYPSLKRLADEKVKLIRSLDGYERFLYYETGKPYSASHVTEDAQDLIHFHADATWPKISGSVVPVASASVWYETQLAIAEHFDRHNQNYLGNSLPFYLKNDENSQEFVKFFDLIGHQFDTIKLYTDQMPYMYDRNNDPTKGLSQDVVWNVAEAFGVSLPNPYAIRKLIDYTVGEVAAVDMKVYRQSAAETWKRFMHNQIYMMKTKGTKASLQALINAYGVLPTTVRIRESATPGVNFTDDVFETYEETTNALRFTTASYLNVPWNASAASVEVRFRPNVTSTNVIFNVGNAWALRATPLSGTFGRLELTDGTLRISSSYLPIYDGDFYSAMVTRVGSNVTLYLKRAENDDLVYESKASQNSSTIATAWSNASLLYLGGSNTTFGTQFSGSIDEFRVWNEAVSESIFDLHVKYPGLYNGNTIVSARDALAIRLSFNTPTNIGGTIKVVPNESPNPLAVTGVSASAFPSVTTPPYNFESITRDVVRYSPNAGSQFTSNKTIIVDPPVYTYFTDVSGSRIPVLSHNQSMVSLNVKAQNTNSNNLIGFYFSLTDAINDNIIRSIGNFDLQNLIGDPADTYNDQYKALNVLNNLYWTTYAYNYNINSFVDFVKELLGPLFEQARELIPARAKLLSGIVHEPHILERAKFQNKALEMSAGRFGRNNETQNLEASVIKTEPTYDAGFPTLDTVFDTEETRAIQVTRPEYDLTLDTSEVYEVLAEPVNYDVLIGVDDIYELIPSYIPMYEMTIPLAVEDTLVADYPTKSSIVEVLRLKYGFATWYGNSPTASTEFSDATLLNGPYVYEPVSPTNDFTRLETYTYFTDANGLVGTTRYVKKRIGANALNSRGAWATGSSYVRNDYVESINATGRVFEFVCITTDIPFISNIPPFMDTGNWRPMTYNTVETLAPKKVAVIDGKVSIVEVDSAEPAIHGYHPTHYKFTRDMRRGRINHQYLGCLQTIDTTTDGKSPIEVTTSGGDGLFVNNPSSPIQPQNNITGPILDIR